MKTLKTLFVFALLFGVLLPGFSGGFIIVAPPGSNGINSNASSYMLEVKNLKVETQIDELIAFTSIDQTFYNPGSQRLEGWFLFPVPEDAVLSNFSMEINGKQTPAELLDADKAKKIYEDIVRKMKDPALLEYANRGLFRVRIFPIEPHSEKRIKIFYREILKKDNNTVSWTFPLNTEKHSAKPLKNLSFKIDIKSAQNINSIYSPHHVAEVIRQSPNKAVVGYEAKAVKPDKDFRLFVSYSGEDVGMAVMSYQEATPSEEDGFFLMNISPAFIDDKAKLSSKDITFVLDVSGSMRGDKMQQAKDALDWCVDNLNKGDRFEIVKFSTVASSLFGKLETANSSNIAEAKKFISKLAAVGGTNMDEAFEIASKIKSENNRPHMIVFITDGKPTIGVTDTKKLLNKIPGNSNSQTRVFTFGVGDDINTHLLDKITNKTGAYRAYIGEGEDITKHIASFYEKVSSPVLTDIDIKSSAIRLTEIFPRNYPDLFKGGSLTILGRYPKSGKTQITLTGKVNGKTKTYKYNIVFSGKQHNDFVPVLWAGRKIGFLLDKIRLSGEEKELTDEVKSLALKYGIITPYTGYLILEDEEIQISQGNIREDDIIFRNRFGAKRSAVEFMLKNKKEYDDMEEESGFAGIQKSSEIQSQTNAVTTKDVYRGASRMKYRDKHGVVRNFAHQSVNVQGRAVYNNGDKWIDQYSVQSDLKQKDILFASSSYFNLLSQEPEVAEFLALGKNIRFVYKQTLYNITD
ncbi:MAG: VIT domain-containing protein [Bacteroidota bacterium]|nr:VIT domain-containing protein [Bacteroidota bacterium]